MKRTLRFFLAVLPVLFAPGAARAEPIPEYVLQKDYENCLGGVTAQQDIKRAQYCSCIRNGMRGWDAEAYAALAIEQMRTQTPAPQLDDLAKACVAKVMK